MTSPDSATSPSSQRLFGAELAVLELIATRAPLAHVLETLCRGIDEQSGLRSSIFLLDRSGTRLVFAAGPNLTDAWRTRIASFPITETACGVAVREVRQVVAPDLLNDPRYTGYENDARAANVRAAWSTPFLSGHGHPLGTFAVYSTVTGPPSSVNLELVRRATHLASIAVERDLSEQALQASEQRFSRAFYANPAAMTISALPDGRLTHVNDAFVRVFGYSRAEAIGMPVTRLYVDGARRASLAKRLEEGTVRDVEMQARKKSGEIRDVILALEQIEVLGERGVLAIVIDITDRRRAEDARRVSEEKLAQSLDHLRALTRKLMSAQDEERRRIARLLHETTAQNLAGVKMLLARLSRTSAALSDGDRLLLDESIQLANEMMIEIRTLSYLLHPPFLDETGLLSAIRWYADGFTKRSGVLVDLHLEPSLPRLSQDAEVTLFRIVQEALMNVHRHSESRTARIRLETRAGILGLEIQDDGKGMPPEILASLNSDGSILGVGLAGMRERLTQLGGAIAVTTSERGTRLRATLTIDAP